ncbi:MAG TPA: hypothetical protein VF980_17520 [Thermoanaerobaculia bacterium]
MKRSAAVLTFAAMLTAASAAAAVRGAWTAEVRDSNAMMQLNLSTHGSNHFGQPMAISDFAGLSEASARAATQTPVNFELRREAGTVAFEGTFKDGFGAGQFTFTPNSGYVATLRNLGVSFDQSNRDDDEMLVMALMDVSTPFIRSMQAEGYRESADGYLQMRIFKVTPELVRELRGLGFDHISADDLVATRIHKVTPDYIRSMRAAGFADLSLEQFVESRLHKATPEFAAQMKALGYGNVSFDRLVEFRIHGVTPDFIRDLADLGYTNIPAERLVEMRIHRVTPQYIRELKDAGYERVPVEKLIEMRIAGIDAAFVKKMNKRD